MARPLAGLKVIEATSMITGPLAGQMLADMGADIIKIERPDGGDPFRTFRDGAVSPYFQAYNRNKRSLALDIQSPIGKTVLKHLLAGADVFIENFRPGVMDRLGFGVDALRAANPALVYCSISGFGRTGPYRDRPAYDAVAQAISGISSLFLDSDNPLISGPTIADNMTGIYACYGILAALHERGRTGTGRWIDVNMLDSALAFMPDAFASYSLSGVVPGPFTRVAASQSYALQCSDGKMIAIHMSSRQKFWEAVCKGFDRPELLIDPRFDSRSKRIDNYFMLKAELQVAAGRRTRAYWLGHLASCDVPHAAVNDLQEVFHDPQVKALDSFAEIAIDGDLRVSVPRRPVWIDGSRGDQPLTAATVLDADGEAIIAELGLTGEEIDQWRASKVAGSTSA
ncbi:MAG: CoA transferase [Sphingomonadaceae bacterium]|nr:CoA transferase [Sphingomonadaceae bacterium]